MKNESIYILFHSDIDMNNNLWWNFQIKCWQSVPNQSKFQNDPDDSPMVSVSKAEMTNVQKGDDPFIVSFIVQEA